MAAGLAVPQGHTRDPGLAGRDTEVAEIGAFLAATAGAPSALMIVGDVGIGKTAVWKHAVQAASGTYRVLSCRPARAEAPLAFAALDDLFGEVLAEILPWLPEPRGGRWRQRCTAVPPSLSRSARTKRPARPEPTVNPQAGAGRPAMPGPASSPWASRRPAARARWPARPETAASP